ncbi:hypothetical protein GIB67_006506 [Kingdonia uniflora]|uniref:Uncharacterized protein n=1 Tax=Kingdonia uniflora TaxID=39325 RepID=A0A7J7LEH6_9MAGN|nr:hypothetical protein GIB67_006506 [Kingdonia uniflora]
MGSHQEMLVLCGIGYWVQGFRVFPWLALNFHMVHALNLQPSMLQLVQNFGNLPMVAKPLYGVLSDALYIWGAHRIPYISIGAFLQVLSWGPLALIPFVGQSLPTLMVCILVSNLGASIAEVAKDALTAEYGYNKKISGLQSYAFMALAAGAILGNMFGGYFLLKTQQPRMMFFFFSLLLSVQLGISFIMTEGSLGLPGPSNIVKRSISENLHEQFSGLMKAIKEEMIYLPLLWIVASISMVPVLPGAIFCYQTQFLKLDSSIIGMSKVIGQLMLLLATIMYDRYWKRIPMRRLMSTVQIVYATSLLLDLILVKQINLKLGVSNELFVLCLSGLAETAAQFKLLPFSVLLASSCPPGCEGSLTSFLASALCSSSIISGFLGVGLTSLIGISAGDYSRLQFGIILQFIAALVPLGWISYVPLCQSGDRNETKRGWIKRSQRT